MPSEFAKKAVAVTGLVILSAAAGVGTYLALTGEDEFGEDRPPIIVQNGTVEFRVPYADAETGKKGEWDNPGNSGTWILKHGLEGPSFMQNEIYNGTCSGNGWGMGPLKITYTNGTTIWTVDVFVTGKHIRVTPQNGQSGYVDPMDLSHLTVGTQGVVTWITRVEQRGGGDYCTFTRESNPVIRIRQGK